MSAESRAGGLPTASSLVPPHIAALSAYKPGRPFEDLDPREDERPWVKLNSNENPLGPSPRALEAIRTSLAMAHRYPDALGRTLRAALSEHYHLQLANVVLGSGSEGVMATIIRAFLADGDEVLTSHATFVGFMVLARSRGVPIRLVPQTPDHRYDLAALADAITPATKLIYLANPNNPTGTIFTAPEFEAFIERVPERCIVLLDEAYCEYASTARDYPDSQRYRFDNVLTLRTFSKAYGLAGMRVGYGIGHAELIAPIQKVKLPFEPSGPAMAAAIAALSDQEYLEQVLATHHAELPRVVEALERLSVPHVATHANFVYLPLASAVAAQTLFDRLLEHGVIVRPMEGFGLPHALRVTIGTRADNDRLIHALDSACSTY